MHRDSATEQWTLVDPDDVTDNENGTFSVTFSSLCPVAFLKTSVDRMVRKISNVWLFVLVIVVILVAVGARVFRPKKNTDPTGIPYERLRP